MNRRLAVFLGVGAKLFATVATWNQTGSGNWNVNSNWSYTTGSTFPNASGDTANFTSSITAPATITLGQTITVGTLTLNNSSNAYTIAGNTLNLTVPSGSAALNVTGSHSISSALNLTSAANITFGNSSSSLAVSSSISGAVALGISGGGTVVVSGGGGATGTWTVSSSTLEAGAVNGLPHLGRVVLSGTGQLNLNNFNNSLELLSTSSASSVVALGTGTLTLVSAASGTFAGILGNSGDTGGLTLSSSSITLSGTSNYQGATTLSGGILSVSAVANLNPLSSIIFSGGTLNVTTNNNLTFANPVNLTGAGTISIATGLTTTLSGQFTGTVSFSKTGTGVLILSNTNNTYSATTNIGAGTLQAGAIGALSSNSAFTLSASTILALAGYNNAIGSLTSSSSSSIVTLGGATLTTGNKNSSVSFAGTLGQMGETGALVKVGSGTLTLSGTNNYSGGTTINAGAISVSAIANLGSGGITFGGGTLNVITNNNLNFTAPVSLSTSGSINIATGLTTTFSGQFTGLGNLSTTGPGVLILSNTGNNYSGTTTLNSGTLEAGASGAFSSSSAVTLTSSSILNAETFTNTIASLTGSSGTSLVLGAGSVLTTGNSTNTTFAGTLSGTGSLEVAGSGTFTFSGTGSVGSVAVSSGTLEVDGALSSTPVSVFGGTLSGVGTVSGSVTVDGGGVLSPGNGTNPYGTLTIGSGTHALGAITNIALNSSQNSSIVASSLSTLGGTVQLTQAGSPTSYSETGQYLIWTGPYNGTYQGGVTGGLPGFYYTLTYDPGEFVFLSYIFSPQINTSDLKGNAKKVADYLNENGDLAALAPLGHLTGEVLRDALDTISPSRNRFGVYVEQQTAFALSSLLSEHVSDLRLREVEQGYLADASDTIPPCVYNKFTGWVSGLGEYAYQKKQNQDPAFHFNTAAPVIGLDYRINQKDFVGGAVGYAHTYFTDRGQLGTGKINSYFASSYGNISLKKFFLSPAIWGMFNVNHNLRRVFFPEFFATATSHIFSWGLLPHLEVGYEFIKKRSWSLTPFAQADWAINWQRSYQEQGAAPYNAKEKKQISSMLRTETGLKFCEKTSLRWGTFFLKEKLSYVFQKPFGTGVTTSLTGIPSSFTVTTLTENLNLGDFAIDMILAIGKKNPTTLSLGYEGEFGSHFWSQDLRLTLAKDF